MTMPIGKLDLLFGYALAFGLLATLQVVVAAGISLTWLGLDIAGSVWSLLLVVVLDALLGTALGLFVSAFARTEFQAIQFLPVFVLPQFLLCGLFVPRDEMGWVLSALSDGWLSYVLYPAFLLWQVPATVVMVRRAGRPSVEDEPRDPDLVLRP